MPNHPPIKQNINYNFSFFLSLLLQLLPKHNNNKNNQNIPSFLLSSPSFCLCKSRISPIHALHHRFILCTKPHTICTHWNLLKKASFLLTSSVRAENDSTMTAGISGGDDYGTPRSLASERRSICSYPFYALSDGLPRLSFSYHKLPPHLFKLSVVKLDGASFDVQISGNATVGELKQAVEDVFTQSPKEGEGTISWSHVWGHFCLCYRGQKLTNDKEYVRSFGIKDGDQLLFIRHLSMNYNLAKRRSKRDATWEEKPQPFAVSDVSELEQSDDDFGDGDRYGKDSDGDRRDEDSENDQHAEDAKYYKFEANEDFIGHPEFKLAHFLKGWLSYSTLWIVGRKKSDSKFRASRFSGQFLRLGSKMTLTRL